jgi:hypothetical protein
MVVVTIHRALGIFLQQLAGMAQGRFGAFIPEHARQLGGAFFLAQGGHHGDGAPGLQPFFHAMLESCLGRESLDVKSEMQKR